MHPMVADPAAPLPEVFYGRYLFWAEMTDEEGPKLRPTFLAAPRGDAKVFGESYREMADLLAQADAAIGAAEPLAPARCRVMFDSDASAGRWFYRTCRTHTNFYESCVLRDRFAELRKAPRREGLDEAPRVYERWLDVLRDELENTAAAPPIIERDVRLDPYYGGDHIFPHGADMIRAKPTILGREIGGYLPGLWRDYERAV